MTYADDTAVVSRCPVAAQGYLHCLIKTAACFGLQPHWGKTVHLRVGHCRDIAATDDTIIKVAESSIYLGSHLHSQGDHQHAISRRIGEAAATLNKLDEVWRRGGITTQRKVDIFEACVLTKLLFGLETLPLSVGSARRLDAFQSRCLRKVLKIAPSFYSRVANEQVMRQAGCRALSAQLRQRQLLLFGLVAGKPDSDPLRAAIFVSGAALPKATAQKRKVGRPRLAWSTQVHRFAVDLAGSQAALEKAVADPDRWLLLVLNRQ